MYTRSLMSNSGVCVRTPTQLTSFAYMTLCLHVAADTAWVSQNKPPQASPHNQHSKHLAQPPPSCRPTRPLPTSQVWLAPIPTPLGAHTIAANRSHPLQRQ
jgi:hypothetical protein